MLLLFHSFLIILCILAGNDDLHERFEEFAISPYLTIGCGLRGPIAAEKILKIDLTGKMMLKLFKLSCPHMRAVLTVWLVQVCQ